MAYIMDLKVKKSAEDQLNRFAIFSKNPQEEGAFYPPSSVQVAVNKRPLYYFNVNVSLIHRVLCYVFSFTPEGQ